MTADILGQSPDLAVSILALNNAHATELSWLDAPRLTEMVGGAFVCLACPPAEALLVAFDQRAAYDSPNFVWFQQHFDQFVYVDRIVVAEQARGQRLASRLYETLFARAKGAGHQRIVCEVNSDPPNPASDAFHARMGFSPVGEARLDNGKTVRYLAKSVA